MMSQFGKNPPWARDVGPISQATQIALNQSQIGIVSQMYGQSAVAAPTVFSLQPGIALPTSLATSHVATVSYPAPRPAASAMQQKQRVFTGAVTKLHENFGFVDEDVFFQTSCVKGQQPKLGDRVLVEASYNASMPFKWNATRIQVLPTNVQAINSPQTSQAYQAMVAQSSFHTIAPASQAGSTAYHYKSTAIGSSTIPNLAQPPPPLMSKQTQPVQGRCMNLGQSSRRPDGSAGFRDRSDRQRERAGSRERRERRSPRKRSRSPLRRSRSPPRSHSPRSPSSRTKSPVRQRRVARPASRYTVQIPKISLDLKEANLMILRSRYGNMYIPSDFFSSAFLWVEAFPAHRPFSLGHSCDFHVLQKTIEPPIKSETLVDPSDADYRYSAKVMLLSCPTLDEIFHKSCALAEDPPEVRESFQHPTRLIQFLVGLKGKSEPMAIGGPWSPSLDGPNPEGDPRCLINTAIRSTKALTGIDLSHCTQWFRFSEIRYYRPEEVRKGRTVPAHVETVVIFLPDVWTCRPTSLEWQTLAADYRKQLDARLSTDEFKTKEEEVEVEKEAVEVDKKDPTHHSELDPKTMKLNDLRQELECRGLSSKGLKSQLIARLTKAIRSEEEKEAEETENRCAEEDENREDDEGGRMDVDEKEEDSKKLEEEEKLRAKEKERANLIRQYTLPDTPSILVRPSATAKGGKFECSVMSLSLLLDYRPEDNKEHVFEVSLFAEMFNEMLTRDFGFRIYKLLVSSPEAAEDEKKDKPKDEDKKDKARSKDDEKKESGRARDADEVKREGSDVEKSDGRRSLKRTSASLKVDELLEVGETDGGEESTKIKDVKHEDTESESGGTISDAVDQDPKPGLEAVKLETEELEPKASSGKSLKQPMMLMDVKAMEEQSRVNDEHDDGKDEKDKKSSRSAVKHDRSRFCTAEPDLLLAFVYFDQSHAGYLVDKDVEEILYTLGLQLSRAQVKKLVSKLASRDMLNYRRLTDVVADKDEDKAIGATAATSDAADQVDDRTLALGNHRFLRATVPDADLPHGVPRKRAHLETEAADEEPGAVPSDGVVMHNGAFVDIDSILQNLDKSEKSRVSMEARLKELQHELDNVRASHGSTESANQTMSSEIQELRKKLRDQRRSLDQTESNAKKYRDLLARTRSTLSTLAGDIKDAVSTGDKDVKAKTEASE